MISNSKMKIVNSATEVPYLKKELKGHYVICYVNFRLTKKNHRINFSYKPLQEILSKNRIKTPTIQEISKFVKKIRKSKLPDPKKLGNCGSFFKILF